MKYRAKIRFNNQSRLYLSAFTDDGKKVFVNGKFMAELSNPEKFTESQTSPYFQSGENLLEISYELFGSTEFGTDVQISELKGIASVSFSADADESTAVEARNIQLTPACMRGRDLDPNFAFGAGKPVSRARSSSPEEFLPSFIWVRGKFVLPKEVPGGSIPWHLLLEADRDALIYLNGKFVGRFVTIGPQCEFCLPEPYFVPDAQAIYSLWCWPMLTSQASFEH